MSANTKIYIKPYDIVDDEIEMDIMDENDEGDGECLSSKITLLHIFGHDSNSNPIVLTVSGFPAWCYVDLPLKHQGAQWTQEEANKIIRVLKHNYASQGGSSCLGGILCRKSKVYFYQPIENSFQVLKLWFLSSDEMAKFASQIERRAAIPLAADVLADTATTIMESSQEDVKLTPEEIASRVVDVIAPNASKFPSWLRPRGVWCGKEFGHLILRVWEGDRGTITHDRRFFSTINSSYTGWIEADVDCIIDPSDPDSEFTIPEAKLHCSALTDEIAIYSGKLLPPDRIDQCDFLRQRIRSVSTEKSNQLGIPSPKYLAFDIESYTDNHLSFPQASNAKHVVYMISVISAKGFSSDPPVKYLIVLATACVDIEELERENIRVRVVPNELELMEEFGRIVGHEDPDVITGYNICGFDYGYLGDRLKLFSKCPIIRSGAWPCQFSRSKNVRAKLKTNPPSKNGMKDTKTLISMGRISIDLLPVIRKDFQLTKYTLDHVSREILHNDSKHDVTPKEMFAIYENCLRTQEFSDDDPCRIEARNKMTIVAKYAMQDSMLVYKLFEKIHVWIGLTELSAVAEVTVRDTFSRGQQCRIVSLLYNKASRENIILDKRRAPKPYEDTSSSDYIEEEGVIEYEGGYVGNPVIGLHDGVITVDFSGLYPSIMMNRNICLTTIVVGSTLNLEGNFKAFSGRAGFYDSVVSIAYKKLIAPSSEQLKIKDRIPRYQILSPDAWKTRDPRFFLPKGTKINKISYSNQKEQVDEDVEEPKYEDDENEDSLNIPTNHQSLHIEESVPTNLSDCQYEFVHPSVKVGILPRIVKELVDKRCSVRESIKEILKSPCPPKDSPEYATRELNLTLLDKRQLAYKIIANSVYGFIGVQGKGGAFPLVEGAMSITSFGRQSILRVNDYVRTRLGCQIIFNDTDSCGFKLPDGIIKHPSEYNSKGRELAHKITEFLNCPPMKLEYEKTMRVIFFAKKKYAAYTIKENGDFSDKLLLRGIVLVRRETCIFFRKAYEKLLRATLDRCPMVDIFRMSMDVVKDAISEIILTHTIDPTFDTNALKQQNESVIQKFEIVKSFKSDYKKQTCPGNVFVGECRRLGRPCQSGDRLGYLVISPPPNIDKICMQYYPDIKVDNMGLRMRLSELWRDLRMEGNLVDAGYIDPLYYIKIFKQPIDQLFTVVYGTEMENNSKFQFIPRKNCTLTPKTPIHTLITIIAYIEQTRRRSFKKIGNEQLVPSSYHMTLPEVLNFCNYYTKCVIASLTTSS